MVAPEPARILAGALPHHRWAKIRTNPKVFYYFQLSLYFQDYFRPGP